MPRSPTPIWILTVALLIANPILNDFYWGQVLRAGVLPDDGDSIGIPIFAALVFTLMVAPFVIGVTRYCLRGYNPRARIAAWRSDRLVRSLVSTIVFGGAASILAVLLASDLRDMFKDYPWYEFTFTPLVPPAIAWSLAMRSAVIERIEQPVTPRWNDTGPWGPREQRI